MPVFEVTAPDGRKLRITAPDGATQEDAVAFAQKQLATQDPASQQAATQESARERLMRENPGEYDPNSPEFRERYGATSGMSGLQKFMAGAGKAVVDLGRGVRQVAAEAGNAVGLVGDETVDQLRADQGEVNARDAALMRTGAGMTGNVVGNLTTAIVPGTAVARGAQALTLGRTAGAARAFVNPTTYRAAAASGAAHGALRPVQEDESRSENTGFGAVFGVLGNAAANAVGRVAQPLRSRPSGQQAQAIRTLEAAGVPLDSAQRSGNPVMQRLRASLSDNPATHNQQAEFIGRQQTAFNRAVLREIGENADAATPQVLDAAAKRIGSYFDAVAQRVPLKFDPKLGADVRRIILRGRDSLLPQEQAGFERLLKTINDKAPRGSLTGEQYQQIKQALDDIGSTGGLRGELARQLRSSFDAALERSAAGTTDFKLLKDARRQWQALKQIEGAIATDGTGAISPAKLANQFTQKKNRHQGLYGRGNQRLVRLAQAGKQVLTEKTPNSGTPARLAAMAAPAAALTVGTGLATGDWETAAKVGAVTYAAPKMGQALLTNRLAANYLPGGLPQGVIRNRLQQASGSPVIRQLPGALAAASE